MTTPHTAPHPALANSRFLAFFDECGDHSLLKIDPDFPLFVLALVVVERAAYRDATLPEITRFKLNYWNHEGINLHSREIRLAEGPFNILLNPRVRPVFMAELTSMVERLPFTLFISAIDKQQHLLRSGPAADEPYSLALKLTMEPLDAFPGFPRRNPVAHRRRSPRQKRRQHSPAGLHPNPHRQRRRSLRRKTAAPGHAPGLPAKA